MILWIGKTYKLTHLDLIFKSTTTFAGMGVWLREGLKMSVMFVIQKKKHNETPNQFHVFEFLPCNVLLWSFVDYYLGFSVTPPFEFTPLLFDIPNRNCSTPPLDILKFKIFTILYLGCMWAVWIYISTLSLLTDIGIGITMMSGVYCRSPQEDKS